MEDFKGSPMWDSDGYPGYVEIAWTPHHRHRHLQLGPLPAWVCAALVSFLRRAVDGAVQGRHVGRHGPHARPVLRDGQALTYMDAGQQEGEAAVADNASNIDPVFAVWSWRRCMVNVRDTTTNRSGAEGRATRVIAARAERERERERRTQTAAAGLGSAT